MDASVAYSMFLGIIVYGTLDWKKILRVSMDTVETTAAITFVPELSMWLPTMLYR